MATFKACVLKPRKDGMYNVYIRVTHNRKIGYINTQKIIDKKGIKKDGSIKDLYILNFCTNQIKEYAEKLNNCDVSDWDLKRLISLLTTKDNELCFSDYARNFIREMADNNQARNAQCYLQALKSIELKLGTDKIMFSMLTSSVIKSWIKSLANTHRAKQMYPISIRRIFNEALKEFNDYDNGNLLIKHNPWMIVDIPTSDRTEKKAISPEDCRDIFYSPLPDSDKDLKLINVGRDVAKLVLCLAGMNAVDIYNLQKSDVRGNIIGYKRTKTKTRRKDEAYMEIRIEPIIKDLIDKHRAPDDDPYFFDFHNLYSTAPNFSVCATQGIKKLCKRLEIKDAESICIYTFRHTWATVAQNDCNASIEQVAFGLNHIMGHSITRGYIKVDFSSVWELNAKVIDFIFFSDKKSKQSIANDNSYENTTNFSIIPDNMVYARAYYKGKILCELSGLGYSSSDAVIRQMIKNIPDNLTTGSKVNFRIKNVDTDCEAIYDKSKGVDF